MGPPPYTLHLQDNNMITYQTLVFKDSNISAFIFRDDEDVILTDNNAICRSQKLLMPDLNSTNSRIWTDTTPPEDWESGKYLFIVNWLNETDYEEEWVLNPSWSVGGE